MLLMVFLACFQMGFLPCDHGLDFEIGLCENSINQSINHEISVRQYDNRKTIRLGRPQTQSVTSVGKRGT